MSQKLLSMLVVDIIFSVRSAIDKQLNLRCVRRYPHINLFALREIPVWEDMHHRCLPVICPLSLIYVVGVLLKASRVYLSEVGVLRLVRRRLSYIIKACPQELSHGKFSIPVHGYAVFAVLSAPVGRTVAKG